MKKKYCAYCGQKLGCDCSEKEWHKKNGDDVYVYKNGDYKWKKDGVSHLMRDGKEIASGDNVYSYYDGDYRWRKDGVEHYCRIIDGYVWENIKEID